ncbi:hypothetical protein, partial [Lysinibacillus fusiformis]|uniref:hypothetical protein n=1 Tax=Lysinibacillus fusiformis TaxID=28031 RepID=UPI00119FFC26
MKDAAKLNLKDMLEAEQIEWADQQNEWEKRKEEDVEERKWIEQQSEWEDQQLIIEQQRIFG